MCIFWPADLSGISSFLCIVWCTTIAGLHAHLPLGPLSTGLLSKRPRARLWALGSGTKGIWTCTPVSLAQTGTLHRAQQPRKSAFSTFSMLVRSSTSTMLHSTRALAAHPTGLCFSLPVCQSCAPNPGMLQRKCAMENFKHQSVAWLCGTMEVALPATDRGRSRRRVMCHKLVPRREGAQPCPFSRLGTPGMGDPGVALLC